MHGSGIVPSWCRPRPAGQRCNHSVAVALGVVQVGAATALITWLALNVL